MINENVIIIAKAFDLLPKTTQETYLRAYAKCVAWKTDRTIEEECFSEAVMLEYFHYLKSKYKPPSLWVEFSMLKATIKKKANIDISYPEVTSLLRKSSEGYRPLQSNVFEPDEIRRFFSEAEDIEFLAVKVIMIFLVHGVTRADDLTNIEVTDVSEQGSSLVIKCLEPKTNVNRSFTVHNEYAACVQRYRELRPENVPHDRFFVNYQNGKCTVQPIGRNKFLKAPKVIATFLNLKDSANYTCHSFRKKLFKPNRGMVTSTSSMDTSTAANEIGEDAKAFDILTKQNQDRYLRVYEKFMAWKTDEKIDQDCFSEAVMLEYFNSLKTKYKPPSLSVEYSILNTTLQKKHNTDIAYPKLRSWLRDTSFGYVPSKCCVFQEVEMRRFLCEAEDNEFLAVKVIMIFGIFGITRGNTLTKVDVNDVSEQGSGFVIKIPETKPNPKTNDIRSFTVENEYAACVQKYKELRPENIPHSRFFISYQNGRCRVQPIGRNKFLNAPKIIANFLNLKDAESYTCDSFRTKLKMSKRKRNAMRSSSLLDSYIEECIPSKRKNVDLNSVDTSTVAVASTIPTTANKICKDVKVIAWDLLPEKSREKYVRSYENFLVWKTDEKVDKECFSEAVMLEYFNYLKTKYKASSLWVEFSMLRTTIQKNDKIDILYPTLKSLLKDTKVGFQSHSLKSNAFRPVDIQRFLSEAEDIKFLVVKVIMIFGIYGRTSADELKDVEVKDVIEQGSGFVIKIPDIKKNVIRSFTVDNENTAYVQKYKNLRPKHIRHRRFFINYQNGKCTVQPIGRNKFLNTPKVIANFLNLEDAENYTGNSFRRTSKKLLADGGGDKLTTKRHGGWSAADNHTEESIANDRKIDDLISEQINFKRSTIQNTSSTITSSMNTSTVALTIPTTFQTYQVQPLQFQPYQLLPYGTSSRANDCYVQPDNAISEKFLGGMQFNNNCPNL